MIDLKEALSSAKAIVIYPCSGDDFKLLVFTTKEFLEYHTNNEIVFDEPDYFIYNVDILPSMNGEDSQRR